MPDESGGLGLKVKITPIIDRSQLNSEAQKVEAQLNKNLKLTGTYANFTKSLGDIDKLIKKNKDAMRLADLTRKYGTSDPNRIAWGETYGKAGGPRGKLEGLFEGLGGKIGGSGIGKAALAGGVAGIAAAGVQGIFEIMKKIFGLLNEASPMLRNIMKMLNQGFMMILRPIGDVIAMLLRPIATFFRLIGRSVIKRMREKRAELKGEGLTGAALGGALMAEMPGIYLDAIMELVAGVDWSGFFDKMLGVLYDNLTQRLPDFITKVFTLLYDFDVKFWTGVWNAMAGFGTWLWGVITDVGKWGLDQLTGLGNWLYGVITGKIGGMEALTDVAGWFYDLFVGVYNAFANKLNPLLSYFGKHIDTILTSSQAEAFSSSSHDAEKRRFYEQHPSLAHAAMGATVTEDGPVYVHRGEIIKDSGNIESMIGRAVSNAMISMGAGANISIAIPGSVLADAMDRRIDAYYRTKVTSRR